MKTEYNFRSRSFFSIGPHLLGLIFIAVGFFTLVSPLFMPGDSSVNKAILVGSTAIVFGGMVITSYPGTFFDFKNKRFKTYYALVGYRIGQWKNLPPIKLVKVFPYTFKGDTTPNGVNPSATIQFTRYIVALYSDQPKPVVALEYDNKHEALEGGRIISVETNATLDKQL
ncbi:MAG: hypothetical protein JWM14_1577 [Chitinophagaceae bacterium]|nr:hypothetical protein [Chitinophagaceae bacterium]